VGCSLYATTQAAARCQQFCRVSNVLQNFLSYSDCSSVTSILLTTHKAPGTDHGNTVLQFRLAVSHPFYKPPTKPLVQTTVTQYYNSDWQSHIHSINLPQSPGTDHGNTVLQFRLAESHPFHKPPTKPLTPPPLTPSTYCVWWLSKGIVILCYHGLYQGLCGRFMEWM